MIAVNIMILPVFYAILVIVCRGHYYQSIG